MAVVVRFVWALWLLVTRERETGPSQSGTMGEDAVGAKCARFLCALFVLRAELHVYTYILGFECIATDLGSSAGRPVTLNEREESPMLGCLFKVGSLSQKGVRHSVRVCCVFFIDLFLLLTLEQHGWRLLYVLIMCSR